MSKYTKGPWKYGVKDAHIGGGIMHVYKYYINSDICTLIMPNNQQELEANAKLIAAAPEMLEALQCIITAFNNAPESWLMTSELQEAEKIALSIIAKATL